MENYITWLKNNGSQSKTITFYIASVKLFQRWHMTKTKSLEFNPANVSTRDLQQWKDYMIHEATYIKNKATGPTKYSESSVKSYLKALKSYFEYLEQRGSIPKNPVSEIRAPKIKQYTRWLADEEKIKRISSRCEHSHMFPLGVVHFNLPMKRIFMIIEISSIIRVDSLLFPYREDLLEWYAQGGSGELLFGH